MIAGGATVIDLAAYLGVTPSRAPETTFHCKDG
jgi:hypothetical protein